MWILFSFASAVFAGLTAVLAKIGLEDIDSHLATAIRTIVVCVFAWTLVLFTGHAHSIIFIESKTFIFLILSGLSTGASWLCYFKALQIGDINKVTPIDKSSTILTILLAVVLLGESMNLLKGFSVLLLFVGTYLMIEPKKSIQSKQNKNSWFLYAFLSAIFASLTAILGKIGVADIDSNLATAIRTSVILVVSWIIVIILKKHKSISSISKNNWLYLVLSGFATGLSWLAYYKALKEGPASVVVPIDKLSIVVTILFARIVLKETLSKKAFWGLLLLIGGTLLLIYGDAS